MTSVLSTLNPLFEKNQTLTKSIYTSFNRSTREGVTKDSTNALVNDDNTASLHYDNDNNLVFDSTSGTDMVVIKPNGDITTKGVINGTCSEALHANTADSVTSLDPSIVTQIENQISAECDTKYLQKDTSSLTLNNVIFNGTEDCLFKISARRTNNINYFDIALETLPSTSLFMNMLTISSGLIYVAGQIAMPNRGVLFNYNSSMKPSDSELPQTAIRGVVGSTITESQLARFKELHYEDKICPSYQFCENTYAKIGSGSGSDSDTSYKSITYDIDEISPYTSYNSADLDISSAGELVLNTKDSSENYVYFSTPEYDPNGGYTEAGIKGTVALMDRFNVAAFKNVKFRMTVCYKPKSDYVHLCKREFLVSDYVGTSNPDGKGVVALFPIDMCIGLGTGYHDFYFRFSVYSADTSKTGTSSITFSKCSKITTYYSK